MADLKLGTPVGVGKFKFPLWAWGAAGVVGYLVWRRQSEGQVAEEAGVPDSSYDAYDSYYSPGYGDLGFGGGGGGGTVTEPGPIEPPIEPPIEEPPIEEPPIEEPPNPGPGLGNRRHRIAELKKRQEAVAGRIAHLRQGGVTPRERRRIVTLRRRRRRIRRRLHRLRSRR